MQGPTRTEYHRRGLRAERRRLRGSIFSLALLVPLLWLGALGTPTHDELVAATGISSVLVTAMMTYVLVSIERSAGRDADSWWSVARIPQLVFGVDLIVLVIWAAPWARNALVSGSSGQWLLVVSGWMITISLVIGVVALVRLDLRVTIDQVEARSEQRRAAAAESAPPDQADPSRATEDAGRNDVAGGGEPAAHGREVVACSGGGIRASAFVLGGLNAMQDRAIQDPKRPEPSLVAVSGGSYMAAAMGLLRGWSPTGSPDGSPKVPWTAAFSLRSPELQRLRRHTRDLVEPRAEVVSAFFQWLLGALVNLSVLFGAVTLLGSVMGWVTRRASALSYARSQLTWAIPSWVLWLLAGLAVGIVLATMNVWIRQTRRDAPRDPDARTVSGPGAESTRRGLGLALLATAFVFVAVPGAVTGLSALAANNQPTPAVARVIHVIGLTAEDQCDRAAAESVLLAARAARADATLSPGEKRSFDAGACGFVTTVTLSGNLEECVSGAAAACPRSDEQWRALGAATLDAAGEVKRTGVAQWALLGAVLSSVVGLIRGGMISPGDGESRLVGRLKRTVFAWVPMLLFGLVLLWVVLVAVFGIVTDPSSMNRGWRYALPLAGLVCAIWVDANVTSLHGYYRRRLAHAFAVRRTPPGSAGEGVAPLDEQAYYSFADLRPDRQAGPAIPLSIATTANIRAYDEAPTRRGGIPFVFSPDVVELALPDDAPHRLDSAAYAAFAGRGRTTIMSAVAMSGAAVSPMAGRYSKAMSPFRLLLTALNIRVGVWVPNPLWFGDESIRTTTVGEYLTRWPAAPWLDSRPGIGQVLNEAAGRGSLLDRWIYLTDGGHLDNTGLVEAVRSLQRPSSPTGQASEGQPAVGGTVIVFDASNDREGTWAAVGDALSVIASDLGVVLTLDDKALRGTMPGTSADQRPAARWWRSTPSDAPPDYARIYVAPEAGLRVLVVKAVRPGDLASVVLPEAVRSFAMRHADFPRAATTRQDFGDLEFEAYRQLGWWCATEGLRLLDRVGPIASARDGSAESSPTETSAGSPARGTPQRGSTEPGSSTGGEPDDPGTA